MGYTGKNNLPDNGFWMYYAEDNITNILPKMTLQRTLFPWKLSKETVQVTTIILIENYDLKQVVNFFMIALCPQQRNLSSLQGSRWNGGTHTVYMRRYLPQKATIPRKGEPYAWINCISTQ